MNRISFGQSSGTTNGTRYSGDRVECVASRLSDFTHIVLRVRKGTARIKSISFHAYYWPTTSISHVLYNLPDGGIKTEREEVSGQQSLDILSNIKTLTYTRTDNGERRLGHVADQVEEAVSELKVSNVTGTTNASLGDEPYTEYKTLDYARIVPLLVSGINTLSARVRELEAKPKRKKMNCTSKWEQLLLQSKI